MLEPSSPPADPDIARVAAGTPRGAWVLCGIAVGVVLAMWLAFYFFVFLPRGILK